MTTVVESEKIQITDFISKLVSRTRTGGAPPLYFGEDAHADVRAALRTIYLSREGKVYAEYDLAEIGAVVGYCFDVVGVPADLEGAIAAEPCIRYMLRRAFQLLVKDERARSMLQASEEVFTAILDDWSEIMRRSELAKHMRRPPSITRALLLSFHLVAYEAATNGGEHEAYLYEAAGYWIHLCLCFKMKTTKAKPTKAFYALLARMLFTHLPESIRGKQDHPLDTYPMEHVKIVLEIAKKTSLEIKMRGDKVLRNRSKNPDTLLTYEIAMYSMLQMEPVQAHDYKVRREPDEYENISDDEPADGSGEEIASGGRAHPLYLVSHVDDEQDEMSGFEPGLDHFLQSYSWSDRIGSITSSEHEKSFANSLEPHNRSHVHAWEGRHLNLFHIAYLYEALKRRWLGTNEETAILAYLLMLMHLGVDPYELLGMVVTHGRESLTELQLMRVAMGYYVMNPSRIRLKRAGCVLQCMRTSDVVYVPLPRRIAELIREIGRDGKRVFSYVDRSGEVQRLTMERVKKYLELINNLYAVNERNPEKFHYGLRLTPHKLARAFGILYHDIGGLDPLVACYVSGRTYYSQYGAQLHYVHIPHEHLERSYISANGLVEEAICRNILVMQQEGMLRTNWRPCVCKSSKPCSPFSDMAGYGSAYISEPSHIRAILAVLIGALEVERDPIRYHNYYTDYLYLLIQFATGLRPRNDPQMAFSDYDRETGILTIRDKQSSKYGEERVVKLPDRLRRMMNDLVDGREKLLKISRRMRLSRSSRKADSMFVKLDGRGVIGEFRPSQIRETLIGLGASYEYPYNMPRHYLSTALTRMGVGREYIDCWMGHQTAGREVLFLASSTTLAAVARVVLPKIDEILDEIGFRYVRYLP